MTDFDVSDHGSIFTIVANTEHARDWLCDYVPDSMGGGCLAYVEHRYALPLMAEITEAGLTQSLNGRMCRVEPR